jgi:zinc protease
MHVYGGFIMQSRLFTEVREKRGLAYSAYCSLQSLRKAANFVGWTSTKNERVAESLEVIHAEALDLAENGPTAEEIDKAKKYLIGSYPLRFDSSGKIAGELMSLRMEDLGVDYVAKRGRMIAAVTKADAKRVARRLFGDGKLVVTVVGKPQGL